MRGTYGSFRCHSCAFLYEILLDSGEGCLDGACGAILAVNSKPVLLISVTQE